MILKFLHHNKYIAFLLCGLFGFMFGGITVFSMLEGSSIKKQVAYMKLDAYEAKSFLTALMSSEKYKEFTLEDFVQCALQD